MRKTLMFGLGLATTLLATSCTKEENFNQTQGIVFSSSISSRATDTSFEKNDEIGISMTPGNITNVLYSTEDGKSFTSDTPITYDMAGNVETVDFTAVYPYKEGSISNSVYSFTLSTDPETPLTENDVMLASSPGISVGSKNVSLNFKHKLVKIVVQLSDANGQAITGAQLKINNQQLAGSLNLSDATVTSSDAADDEMPFAANVSISGQYQTIVMPSAPVQGRYIEVSHEGKTYTLPVDNQEFVSGKKLSFTATLNPDGTVDSGKPIIVNPTVSDWDEKIESGWILTGEISVVGKNAKQLASNIQLNSGQAVVINNFTGTLNQDDIYCISYTRAGVSTLSTDITEANITITPAAGGTGKTYTLPAGQAEGKLLIKVGENTSGISITTTDSGITLSDVTVYTSSSDVAIPITLWEGDATSDTNWPYSITNFTIEENHRETLKVGAKLYIYYTKTNQENGITINFDPYTNGNYGTAGPSIYDGYNGEDCGDYISITVLTPLLEAIQGNNYIVGLTGSNCTLTKILLVPASEDETVSENLLWKGTGPYMYSIWQHLNIWLPKNISVGGTIRVYFNSSPETTLQGAILTYVGGDNPYEQDVVLPATNISANSTSIDFVIDESIMEDLESKAINKNSVSLIDNLNSGLVITSVEYIPAQ